MKWRIAYLVFAVVAGLLLTVGNAWVCALRLGSSPTKLQSAAVLPPGTAWPIAVPPTWNRASYLHTESGRGRCHRATAWKGRQVAISKGDIDHYEYTVREFEIQFTDLGFPTPLMRATQLVEFGPQKGADHFLPVDLSAVCDPTPRSVSVDTYWIYRWLKGQLPLEPLPISFAIHWMLVASVIAAVAYTAERTVIPSLRRRRNLCTVCAYNLTGLASGAVVCPECGKAMHSATAAKGGGVQQVPEAP